MERGLEYAHSGPALTATYLEAPPLAALGPLASHTLLDIGCGTGVAAAPLAAREADITGIDLSESGIVRSRAAHPQVRYEVASVYDDLNACFGTFDRFGYLKNVVLEVSGKLDAHFTVLWDGGHIKFFSQRTLATMLEEAGFVDLRFQGAGRVPLLWKSLVASGRRPDEAA